MISSRPVIRRSGSRRPWSAPNETCMETSNKSKPASKPPFPARRSRSFPTTARPTSRRCLLDRAHARAVAQVSARRSGVALRLRLQRDRRGLAGKNDQGEDQSQENRGRRGKGSRGSSRTENARYLEAVYHLYSMALKHGPLILRLAHGKSRGPASRCLRSRRSGAVANSRSARFSICTASSSTAIPTCAGF